MPLSGRINILPEAVARKIAAGEVIERPQSVARELLDNSLDAESTNIDVYLEGGGNDLIRISDNGVGMSREDLEKCYLPHATSKIATEDDLRRLHTLGFRGEALSSMAAVSRLTVTSQPAADGSGEQSETGSGPLAHRLEVSAGKLVRLGPAAGTRGTTVEVAGIFFNMPARKRFLKRAASESAMVRSALLDKALAFPEVSFRLFSGTDLRLFLPESTRIERIAAAYPEKTQPALLHSLNGSGDGFHFEIIAGEPAAARRDRKQLQVFVNRRRIWEYALVQALEYSYRDYLHGGLFPIAYLYLTVEPELVDFNIHPAKREARFRNLPDIHRRVVEVVGSYVQGFNRSLRSGLASGEPRFSGLDLDPAHGSTAGWTGRHDPSRGQPTSAGLAAERPPSTWAPVRAPGHRQGVAYDLTRTFELPQERELGFRYLGQLFGLFLVVERGDRLYLVDQHAAHERIIYDRLAEGPAGQELLFPVTFDAEETEGDVIAEHAGELARLGVDVRRTGPESWELVSVPASVEIETEALIDMIRDLVARPSDFSRELYASMSCRAAVMDGDPVSHATAVSIIADSLEMTNARCPHGRPIWAEFTREDLMRMVGRV